MVSKHPKNWNEIKTNDSWALFKIMSEFVYGYERLSEIGPCVSIFGSARLKPDHKYYKLATEMAEKMGLILVDTKYEFGKRDGKVFLIDEVHTPDSSRYFYRDGYKERFRQGLPQRQLSKEFVREWLMERGFQGEEGEKMPKLSDEFVHSVSERYIELYETITGYAFEKADASNVMRRVEENVLNFLKAYNR